MLVFTKQFEYRIIQLDHSQGLYQTPLYLFSDAKGIQWVDTDATLVLTNAFDSTRVRT